MPRRLRRSHSYPSPPPVETLAASTRRRRPSEWVHAAIADLHGELDCLKSFNAENFALTELVCQLPDEISHEIMDEDVRLMNVREWLCRSDAEHRDKLLACGAIIVARLRMKVLEETMFMCSAGIAHNKVDSVKRVNIGIHLF